MLKPRFYGSLLAALIGAFALGLLVGSSLRMEPAEPSSSTSVPVVEVEAPSAPSPELPRAYKSADALDQKATIRVEEVPDAEAPLPPRSAQANELFERIRQRQAEARAARQAALQQRQDFLASVDPELLSEPQQEIHQRFLSALVARDEAREAIRQSLAARETTPPETLRAFQEASRTLRTEARAERALLSEALARSLSFDEAQTADFLAVLSAIYDATDLTLLPKRP